MTKFKFVIVTDYANDDVGDLLWILYSRYFISCVVENGLMPVEFRAQEGDTKEFAVINNGKFIEETDRYLQSLSIF